MDTIERKWQFILFAVIVVCSVVLAIFLVWFTKSLFGLFGLLFVLTCAFFVEDNENELEEEQKETI